MLLRGLTPFFAAILSLFVACHAQGQGRTAVFTVPEVPVYAEAETAADAQRIAQSKGRLRAMDILLRRLTAEEDWAYLPRLAAGEPADVATDMPEFGSDDFMIRSKRPIVLSASELPQLEEGFAIFDEKSSGKTYRARISYRFKPDSIRAILQEANLPYSESQSRRSLILPVLETDNGLYLWETKNPWARAWLSRPLINELTPFVLPVGDQQDVETASAEQVKDLNGPALAPFTERYSIPQIIVAHGKLTEKNGQFELYVRLVDAYWMARLSDGPDGAINDDGEAIPAVQLGNKGRTLAEGFFRGETNDFPALAQRAVETVVARYASSWKEQTLVDHSAVRQLSLTAWFSNLDEWAQIRGALEATSLVRDMKVGAFNNENAVMDLTVLGDPEQLILEMRQSNLTVWQASNGRWNIAGLDRARLLQAELERISTVGSGGDDDPFAPINRNERRFGPPLGMSGQVDEGPELPDDLFGDEDGQNDAVELDEGSPIYLEPAGLSDDESGDQADESENNDDENGDE